MSSNHSLVLRWATKILVPILGLLLLLLMLPFSASCKKNTEQLRIGVIIPSIGHLPLTHTINQSLVDINKYQIVPFNSGWEAQEALIGKDVDAAIIPFTYAWNAASKGYPIQIVSFLERQSDGIVVRAGINNIKDLNNKKIGVLKASTVDILMLDFAERYNLKYTTVYFRTPNEQIAALKSGNVDAIVSYVPLIQKLMADYSVIHWFGDDFPMHPCCDIAVNTESLSKEGAKLLIKLCKAMSKELPRIHSFDDVIVDAICSDFKLTREQATSALKNTGFMMGLEQSGKDFENQMIRIAVKHGYIDKISNDKDIYWDIMFQYEDK